MYRGLANGRPGSGRGEAVHSGKRVAFLGRMPARGVSGGRLVAIHWAEALAQSGYDVDFIVDQIPLMAEEFPSGSRFRWLPVLETYGQLKKVLSTGFDLVIVVPHTRGASDLEIWGNILADSDARKALLSFETPNWFNALSPVVRPDSEWDGWSSLASDFGLALAISRVGQKWARDYYPAGVKTVYCYPNVNFNAASFARGLSVLKEPRQIIVLSRPNPHKGLDQLELLPSRALRGWRVRLFLGRGKLGWRRARNLKAQFNAKGMVLDIRGAILGVDKFVQIKQSAMVFFPTYFEGFGIPPVEAQLMGVPAVVSDLPVTRETGAGHYEYFENNEEMSLQAAIAQGIENNVKRSSEEWFDYIASPKRVAQQLIEHTS